MKRIKIWIYLWPEDKKLKDGQIMWKRVRASTQSKLKLREYQFYLTPLT